MKRTRAFPVVISGPSGVGKTTLVERLLLLDPRLAESISTTTRAPREGEQEGEAYFFVTDREFEKLKDGALIEWAVVHGQSYGTPKEFVSAHLDDGWEVVLNIDVQGGVAVKKCFPNAAMIFILPPSSGELESRIRERGTDDSEEIRKRLEKARQEIGQAAAYD
ncbi:MAG: guanylate kinase, partial [bacterium]|nr:guanylate kinase [bacterium]